MVNTEEQFLCFLKSQNIRNETYITKPSNASRMPASCQELYLLSLFYPSMTQVVILSQVRTLRLKEIKSFAHSQQLVTGRGEMKS